MAEKMEENSSILKMGLKLRGQGEEQGGKESFLAADFYSKTGLFLLAWRGL